MHVPEISLSREDAESLRNEVRQALKHAVASGGWRTRQTGEGRTDYFLPDSLLHYSAYYVQKDRKGDEFELSRFVVGGEITALLDSFDRLRYSENTVVASEGQIETRRNTLTDSQALGPTRRLLASMTESIDVS